MNLTPPSRAEQTRQRLLEAAAKEFTEQGFTLSSASRIAAKAGLTRGSLYYHFASKEALFEAVYLQQVEGLMGVLGSVIRQAAEHPERLSQLLIDGFNGYFDYVERDTYRRICLLESKAVLGVERVFRLDNSHVVNQLAHAFQMMMDEGLIHGINAEMMSVFIIGIADQAALMLTMEHDPLRKKALRTQILASIQRLVKA